jgi:hypothetical protein
VDLAEAKALVKAEANVHERVVCDACRTASAGVCARRELEVTARLTAVPKFRRSGWHHDPGRHGREREL